MTQKNGMKKSNVNKTVEAVLNNSIKSKYLKGVYTDFENLPEYKNKVFVAVKLDITSAESMLLAQFIKYSNPELKFTIEDSDSTYWLFMFTTPNHIKLQPKTLKNVNILTKYTNKYLSEYNELEDLYGGPE